MPSLTADTNRDRRLTEFMRHPERSAAKSKDPAE
jgi:hypothetical protein